MRGSKPRIIKSVDFTNDFFPMLTTLESEILPTEKKTFSELVRDLLSAYVREHGKGNPAFKLDAFTDPKFVALPTPWGSIGKTELAPFSWKEDDDMIRRLEAALANVKLDRQAKRDEEIKAKMQPGDAYAARTKDTGKPRV